MLCTLTLAALFALAPPPTCRVPATPTPIGEAELAAVLRDAHHAETGAFPPRQRLTMATAHVMFETGRAGGFVASEQHNLGAIGAPSGPFVKVAGHRLRAAPDFVDGARAYWRTVLRCGSAVRAFDDFAPEEAARALNRCGYSRTPDDRYGRALRGLVGSAGQAVSVL
jgi:hypothetical protein